MLKSGTSQAAPAILLLMAPQTHCHAPLLPLLHASYCQCLAAHKVGSMGLICVRHCFVLPSETHF